VQDNNPSGETLTMMNRTLNTNNLSD
jgi:hypothetical protein